ncbi:MAG: T9SS type A sorting domain-containing protein [Bacteroidetes bacterium]|nr:T9SS type A sorting domain-containing protein [Bacteroidota bacterium]
MLQKILFTCILMFLMEGKAQIPNADFENWTSTTFEKPKSWVSLGKPGRIQGYKSPSALRIQRDATNPDAPGAALLGTPIPGGISGGLPFSVYPDSVVGYFKWAMSAGDTGVFYVDIRKKGKSIASAFIPFYDTDSSKWLRIAAPFYFTDTGNSDTIIVAILASNPSKKIMGSWLEVDSVHFSGGVVADIPNGNFESFLVITRDDLNDGWYTPNLALVAGSEVPVSKSTDHVFGKYSARIQNLYLDGYGLFPGYILSSTNRSGALVPSFKADGKDSMLYLNYKFLPQNNDTMSMGIYYYDSGTVVGAGFFSSGATQNSWKEIGIPVNYSPLYSGTPDSATLYCAAFQGGQNPRGESVLFIDGLRNNIPMNKVGNLQKLHATIQIFPNPAVDKITAMYTALGDVELTVLGMDGKKWISKYYGNLKYGNYSGTIEISDFPDGVYLLCISDSKQIQTIRFLKNSGSK